MGESMTCGTLNTKKVTDKGTWELRVAQKENFNRISSIAITTTATVSFSHILVIPFFSFLSFFPWNGKIHIKLFSSSLIYFPIRVFFGYLYYNSRFLLLYFQRFPWALKEPRCHNLLPQHLRGVLEIFL